jgi:DNA-binding NarL/FixJ family response regulator
LRGQRIAQVALALKLEGNLLRLEFSFAAEAFLSEPILAGMRRQLGTLGGELAIGRTSQGQTHLSIGIPYRREISFTRREQQVLEALVQGLSNKQIAAQLSVSPRTVNYHLDNIYSKLGVRTRTEAAVIASRQDGRRSPSADAG